MWLSFWDSIATTMEEDMAMIDPDCLLMAGDIDP